MRKKMVFYFAIFLSVQTWAGVGGSVGGSSTISMEHLRNDDRFKLKSPPVIFKAGYSTLFMQAIDTCLAENEEGLTLHTIKPHLYFKDISKYGKLIEASEVLKTPIEEDSHLLDVLLVEVYGTPMNNSTNEKPLFIKEFTIPSCNN